MVCLKDLKRSLALTLCSVLVLSGIDTTVFAESSNVPEITSNLTVATMFYDLCSGYESLNAHKEESCKYANSEYGSHFGLDFTDSITVPVDFGSDADLSNYSKDNIDSIILSLDTDNLQVEYETQHLQEYLPFGYYRLNKFDSVFLALFDLYVQDAGADVTDKVTIQDLAEEFYSNDKEFSLTFNYSGGTSISTEVHLLLYDYIASHGTSGMSITDVIRETVVKADSNKGVYSERLSTSSSYVISVPTSKTIVDKDFYKSDDNAIVAVKEDDVYNTYYINIDSDKDISLPLDDLTYEDTITKVKLDDTTVYNSTGITLNGGDSLDATKEDMHNGKSYWITDKDDGSDVFFTPSARKYDLSSLDRLFRKMLYTSKFNYNGNEIDLDDIDLWSIDLKDFIENGIAHYGKYNKRLDNGEKFNDGKEYTSYYFENVTSSTYYDVPIAAETKIFFEEPISFSGVGTNADEDECLDKTISGFYSDDNYATGSSLTSDYKEDTPIKSFYTHKDLPSEYEDKFDKESTTKYSFDFDKLNCGISSDYGSRIFLRLPEGDETNDFSDMLYRGSTYGKRIAVYIESEGCYDDYAYYKQIKSNYVEDSNGDSYAYINVNAKDSNWLITQINNYYSTSYSSIDELLLDFGTPMYRLTIPNDTPGLDTTLYAGDVADFIVGSTETTVLLSSIGTNHYLNSGLHIVKLRDGYLKDNGYICPVYKYTAKSVGNFITLKGLDLSADSYYAEHEYNGRFYKFSYYYTCGLRKLSEIDKCYAKSISFSLNRYPDDIGYDMSVYGKFLDKVLGMLDDLGAKIDYDKSYTPDFLSGEIALKDLFDVSVYDTTSILYSDYTSAKDCSLDVGLGTYATSVDSISTDNNWVSIAKCSDTNLVIPNSFFNASSVGVLNSGSTDTSLKGKDMSIYMQVRADMPICGVKNAVLANKAEIYKKDSYTGVDKLIENSDVLTPPEGDYKFFDTYLGSYVDYKFGNIKFASKPSAPLDLTLDGDKLTWVKPIDEGLGYTAKTRSNGMSIRSISPNFTSKTDDVIHLESYKLDIKDSLGNVVHTQTLTDTGNGLKEEITIPATYLSGDYTAYVYATNKVGVSDSATINLEAPNGNVEVVTERDTYKVGDTITYTETITNNGSVELNNVKVTQSLTGGTYEAQAGVSLTDNVATITSLPVGSSMELKYKYVVPNSVNVGDTISNKVSITSDEGISKDVTKNVTVVELKGSVGVVTERDSYKVGDTITYTETVTNNGTIDLTNVKVTQSLTGGTYNAVTGVTTTDNVATIPALNQGDSVTLTYKYVVPAGVNVGDIISNTVSVTSNEGLNTSVTKTVTVVDSIKDLDLDVTTDKSSYKPGDTVILKSSVKNTGEVDLTNVKITQQLDGEYIPKSGVTMTGKDASIPTLAVGETVEVEYKIVIPSNYNQTSISNKTDVTADGGVSKNIVKTITVVLPKPTKEPAPAPVVTKAPTPVPTKAPTAEPTPTKAPTQEPTKAPIPTKAPTAEPTKAPTPVPEYDFTIKDKYYNEDGTEEIKERENVRIKEGESYSFSALPSDDYIPRVDKYEGIATKDMEIIFEYDEKEKRVTLQGYVTYSDGSPIKDKLIEISGKESKSGITDGTGFYRIENILVGDYNYTLYNDVTTGSGILAKCDIKVIKKNGTVEVKYTDDDCKVDYTTEDGVIRVNANIKKEEVATPSPIPTAEPTLAPTQEPTLAPTQEPTVAPTIEPTVEPTVKPTKKPTPVSTKKPTSTPKPTKKPVAPIKVSTPEPTRKPTRVVYLAQTGIYDIKKVVSAGILIISGLGLVIIALRRRKK